MQKALTGASDLKSVKFLEIKVDSRKTGLGNLGKCVPNVQQLKLNNSYVPRVRDLGSGFASLRVLWMARCELEDIDGIGSLHALRELYLAYNQITDISSISLLEHLGILDLERYGPCNDIVWWFLAADTSGYPHRLMQ
nr:hypothetical protein HK105_006658 [Polyrhizophydium stewartii]